MHLISPYGATPGQAPSAIITAVSESNTSVRVTFAQQVGASAALENAGNYSIPGLTIHEATQDGDADVVLRTSSQVGGATYTVSVSTIAILGVPAALSADFEGIGDDATATWSESFWRTVRINTRPRSKATQIQFRIGGTSRWALRAAEVLGAPKSGRR